MFGSQALETAIGLVMMFFVIALASTSIIEVYSRLLKKRSKDLEAVIAVMLRGSATYADPGAAPPSPGIKPTFSDPNVPTGDEQAAMATWQAKTAAHNKWSRDKGAYDAIENFKATSVFLALQEAARRRPNRGYLWAIRTFKNDPSWEPRERFPSYMSAKAFADAVSELIVDTTLLDNLPPGLAKRLRPIIHEVGEDSTRIKAGIERWFDDTMERMEGAYKRWATVGLFITGLVLSIAANASTVDVARELWTAPATRQAVAEAATGLAGSDRAAQCPAEEETGSTDAASPASSTAPTVACQIESVAATVDTLESLGLPIGWDNKTRSEFSPWYGPWEWSAPGPQVASALLGWIVTALLVMLGAPFWFDVLNKLASLRSTGGKPNTAASDPSSNTTAAIRRGGENTPTGATGTTATGGPAFDPNDALMTAFGL